MNFLFNDERIVEEIVKNIRRGEHPNVYKKELGDVDANEKSVELLLKKWRDFSKEKLKLKYPDLKFQWKHRDGEGDVFWTDVSIHTKDEIHLMGTKEWIKGKPLRGVKMLGFESVDVPFKMAEIYWDEFIGALGYRLEYFDVALLGE